MLDEAERDSSVRVVLLTGGEDCFTSGNDVADFIQAPPTGLNSEVFRFMRALFELQQTGGGGGGRPGGGHRHDLAAALRSGLRQP